MNLKRKVLFLPNSVILVLFALFLVVTIQQYKKAALAESISSKIIRFHVLANSDSEKDQELKLKVRDAVGEYMQQELAGLSAVEESRMAIQEKLGEIALVAGSVIKEAGFGYEATASLAKTEFPPKSYGALTFPAGNYEALQVMIGKGEGQNWWCVMYPNLCFRDGIYELDVDASSGEGVRTLQNALTPKEYKSLMEGGEYELRFRWLSFLNP